MDKTTTRSTLSEAVFKNVGLSRNESSALVDSVFNEILKSLIEGDDVKISSFGTFIVRNKKERIGRNPKTGEEVPILPRKVLVFRASHVLKDLINKGDESLEVQSESSEDGHMNNSDSTVVADQTYSGSSFSEES